MLRVAYTLMNIDKGCSKQLNGFNAQIP